MPRTQKSNRLYPHPFSKAYWLDAAAELKDTKMLVFAALMIALRVALKLVAIPLAPGLKINTAFLANALGAMVFGPVVAAAGAVVSDLLGCIITGDIATYFPPFVLTEVAGSVIFGLFLYRAKLSTTRVMLSRFCICFFVNVLLQTPIMLLYYKIYVPGATYTLTVPGIVKNLFMFPIESVVLSLFLSVMQPITYRMQLTYDPDADLEFSKKQIASLICLSAVGIGSVLGYLVYHYDTTSLSASYTTQQRVEANKSMAEYVLDNSDQWDDAQIVTVVESAYSPFLSSETTYNVALYTVNEELSQGEIDALWELSKSKAAKNEHLTRAAEGVIVADEKTGALVSFQMDALQPDAQ
ncbi:MAG: folate family ECF transporter S component [Oscillospiraceae bacterium]|nr:folate family ECF transporter S component [Oscillospiraceae bacterium]